MIIGNGLISTAFARTDIGNTIIFGSGVSDSSCKSEREFQREENKLRHALYLEGVFIYFSTCSINRPDWLHTSYIQHKLYMESIIKKRGGYIIIRIPQVTGNSDNKNLITNYISRNIIEGNTFDLWPNVKRCIIDVDDLVTLTNTIINKGVIDTTVELSPPDILAMRDIVSIFEDIMRIKALSNDDVNVNDFSNYDTSLVEFLSKDVGIDFGKGYSRRVIQKYYGLA